MARPGNNAACAVPQDLDAYVASVSEIGLEATWDAILAACLDAPDALPPYLSEDNLGEVYEMGLAEADKIEKKELGKYYTPSDVASMMSSWLADIEADCVADVACGTGNLIRAYLDLIGDEAATELIGQGRLWLYDLDPLAMRICTHILAMRYGRDALDCVHTVEGDFLDSSVRLPDGCKVISNPPYYKISDFPAEWDATAAARQCKDLYGAFLEKIVDQSVGSVVITPYSFIGASKFSLLRKGLDAHPGFVVSWDNVPASVFNGRKHGIFNTNHVNSVRAAITVTSPGLPAGRRVTPLIRFSTEERGRAVCRETVEALLPESATPLGGLGWPKVMPGLEQVLSAWQDASDGTFGQLASARPSATGQRICVPTTCRYFLSGTRTDLARTGKRTWHVTDGRDFAYCYAMVNSSFAYWHWRLYDGGVNYSMGLLSAMPTFAEAFRADGERAAELEAVVAEMVGRESEFFVYKQNAGKPQQNVKFPVKWRDRLNRILLDALGCEDVDVRAFDAVHSPNLPDLPSD